MHRLLWRVFKRIGIRRGCRKSQQRTSRYLAVILLLLDIRYVVDSVYYQRAKKVVSDSAGQVDFAIGLLIFVLNLPDRHSAIFWGNSNYRRIVVNPANQKGFGD